MVQRDAKIRRFEPSDDKVVRFAIGKAAMESLAVANRRAYMHPLVIAAWMLLSYVIISFLNLWPVEKNGIMGYLRPIPMLAASTVPIMFLIDWLNRPGFEQEAQEVLHGPDMIDMHAYYSRQTASGLWICEFGDHFVGLIALDANPEMATKTRKNSSNKTPVSAIIRHFYVDEVYRSSGIQEDLLTYALRMAFDAEPGLKVVNAYDSQLIPYVRTCLRDASFVLQETTKKIGVLGWQLGRRSLSREEWEKKDK
ncbi:hypothetical protein J132_09858 [Termitomyces sp. J132]|nr:hypothetical protein C0989_002255 [Termitomyces sp. Mn162]KAH0590671.1 hypothetical protein H2248_000801 [Termitomyces sp. 'cryptogamus']KNZ71404.1 hypothetical protein J132_09858 [Termitomyces sp. J132]